MSGVGSSPTLATCDPSQVLLAGVSGGFPLDGVSTSVFCCTSTPMETGPMDACVET